MRLGKTGDASRPLGWKKIAAKLNCQIGVVRDVRRSTEYFEHIVEVCTHIGIVRLQAKAARKNRSLQSWLENAFGLDIYSARLVADSVDISPLPMSSSIQSLSEEEIEELAEQADNMLMEPTRTLSLTRKHIKWLVSQGYAVGDRLLLRASSMTRGVCSRHTPDWAAERSGDKK